MLKSEILAKRFPWVVWKVDAAILCYSAGFSTAPCGGRPVGHANRRKSRGGGTEKPQNGAPMVWGENGHRINLLSDGA